MKPLTTLTLLVAVTTALTYTSPTTPNNNRQLSELFATPASKRSLQPVDPYTKTKNLDFQQSQKETITRILIICLILFIIAVVIWKVWSLSKTLAKNTKLMEEFEQQIENIEDGSEEYVISSINDMREGIHFFENPLRMYGFSDHVTKMQELNKKIYRLKREIAIGEGDIENLKERNDWYKNQIKDLNDEFERRKKENYDIGHAHGFSESLLRECD